MAHIHRTGPVDPATILVKVTSSVPTNAIEVGDLLAIESGFAVPSTAFTWSTDLATTRTNFAAAFLGLSDSRSRQGVTDTRDLEVMFEMDGNIEFDCASAAYVVGDYLAPAKAAGNALVKTVEKVATKATAIAIVVKSTVGSQTRVLARLINTPPKR
jgi:hypothetical protein